MAKSIKLEIEEIKRYFVRMSKRSVNIPKIIPRIKNGNYYFWEVVTYNGHSILISKPYKNRAQCRNVGKAFSEYSNFEWRE